MLSFVRTFETSIKQNVVFAISQKARKSWKYVTICVKKQPEWCFLLTCLFALTINTSETKTANNFGVIQSKA